MAKKKTPKKMERIHMLVTEWEKNQIQLRADMKAGGNLTAYLVFQALEAPSKMLNAEDLKRKTR